jgi:hypothetical protein
VFGPAGFVNPPANKTPVSTPLKREFSGLNRDESEVFIASTQVN